MAALDRGNKLRTRRAQLKRELKAGEVLLSEVLLSEEEWLGGTRVREILLATPGIGKKKADRALQSSWISQSARLGGASRRAKEALLATLDERADKITVAPPGWEAAA